MAGKPKFGEGWVFISGATKWHYVDEEGRSLCGKWLYLGSTPPEKGNDYSKDNCTTCVRKTVKRGAGAA